MERKLVSIKTIDEINPIEGADQIEMARVGGWQVVVGKGEHKVGDTVMYFEIDSFLPLKEPFMFLKDRCYKKLHDGTEGMRLKTIKLRGQISQGLIIGLDKFPDIEFSDKDYSEELGVIKYEPPIPAQLSGVVKGNFPTHLVPKTDQERIQNLSGWFDKYKNIKFEKTLKYDGTSMTVIYHKDSEEPFMICSRNLMLDLENENTYTRINSAYDLKGLLEELGMNLAIQGEVIGEGIQKNNLNIVGQDFYVFDIYNIDKQQYMSSYERIELCNNLGLKHVDIVDINSYPFRITMHELILDAENAEYGDKTGEGFVYKSLEPVDGNIISFKVINNRYLLKNE